MRILGLTTLETSFIFRAGLIEVFKIPRGFEKNVDLEKFFRFQERTIKRDIGWMWGGSNL